MKTSKIIKTLLEKDKRVVLAISFFLILVSIFNLSSNYALEFLEGVSDEMFVSLGIALELKSVAATIGSSEIPFASGISMELGDIFDKTITYLTFSNIMIATQTLILKLSQSWLFKLLPILLLVGVFSKKYAVNSVRFLIVALLLNPGLSLYVNSVHFVANNMDISIGSSLEKHLKATHDKFQEKKASLKKKQSERKRAQLVKAHAKGYKGLSLLTKVEDFVRDKTESIGVSIKSDFAEAYIILKESKRKLLDLAVDMISNTIFLFMILPMLYFYMMNFVLKKFFHFSMFKSIN